MKRWALLEDFNPLSSHQIKAYCAFKRYPLPKDRKTKKPTTNKEALEGLLTLHPEDRVLEAAVEARHLSKASSYLSEGMVGGDGRIHPLYTFLPKTGRLSSKRPNLLNLPQGRGSVIMEEAARAIRGAMIPSPGMLFGEFDWKAIEALLVGWFAQDEDYMRVARLGVHAYVASHGIGQPADLSKSDEELLAFFSKIKKAHPDAYALFKKANHAYNYGMGERNMAKDLGVTIPRVREIRAIIDKAAPKVKEWKNRTLVEAHTTGLLVTPFGYPMNFFEALTKGEDGKWRPGKEANEALAFKPQSTGSSILRETLLSLQSHPLHGKAFHLLIPIHDSIAFEMEEGRKDEIMALVKGEMEREWPQLGGLKVEAEGKMGTNLRDMALWA